MTQAMETEDFLAHYGVVGMKWGKRKARDGSPKTRPTGREIKDARVRVGAARRVEIDKQTTRRAKVDIALKGEYSKKLSDEYRANPDRAIAFRMTRGEKALAAILAVPSGGQSLTISAINGAMSKNITKNQKQAAERVNAKK